MFRNGVDDVSEFGCDVYVLEWSTHMFQKVRIASFI